jgi:PAS domain S-box-containing protein
MVFPALSPAAASLALAGAILLFAAGWWLSTRRRAGKASAGLEWDEERLQQYEALLAKSLAGVYLIQDEKFVYANPRFAEILGRPEAQFTGQLSIAEIAADPANRDLVSENLRRRQHGEVEALHYILRARRPDGRELDLEVFGTRTEYRGRPAVIGTALDITERRRAEEALRQSEQRTSLILDNATDLMALFAVEPGPALRLVSFNRRYLELARASGTTAPEELTGRTLDDLIGRVFRQDPSSIAQTFDRYREVVTTGRKARFEETHLTGRGPYHAETVLTPVLDAAGQCAFVLFTSTDITERRRADLALARSEESHRALFEEASDPIAVIGEDGRIAEANPRLCQWLGYTHEELSNRFARELLAPEESAAFEQRRGRLQNGPLPPREYQFRHRDGLFLRAEVNAKRLRDGRTLCILRDTTERRRSEETRRHLENQLQQAQKMQAIGTLAGGIAHDFNNILTAILGNAELLRMGLPEQSRGREHAGEILDAGRRARDLVRQILAFSRRQDQERREYPLTAILTEVLRLVRVTLPRNIEIRTELSDEEMPIEVDATQMHQVIVNLCTNAAHAMRAAGGVITISGQIGELPNPVALSHPQLRSGPYVCLGVADTGHGMDAATVQRIFEPFFTTKGPGEGTGLGLAVVHGIVGAHDGAITVESTPGVGTCFRIYLPAGAKATGPAAAAAGPAGIEPATRNERLLFVDDDESVRLVGKPILERLGYRVSPFPTGNAALDYFRAHPQEVDLIVSDFSMPGIDGVELALAARALRPGLPFVLLSGYGDAPEAGGAGIRHVLAKPFSMSALSTAVREALAARA